MAIKFKRKDDTTRIIKNGEYIPAYYFIPKELLEKCGAELNSIPRRPKDLLYDERALAVVESDLFLLLIVDAFAMLVWPHMGLEPQMEIYSGDAPEWRYAHAAPMWINGLEELGALPKPQELLYRGFHQSFGYVSMEEASAALSHAVPVIMEKNHVQEILDCAREYRCFEDYDYRKSQPKAGFYRKWYHTRTLHPQISLESFQADYADRHDGEQWEPPDVETGDGETILSQVKVEQFMATLSEKDRQILKLRLDGHTLEDIADRLGYQNHSGVLKRIRKIGQAYEVFSHEDIDFTSTT